MKNVHILPLVVGTALCTAGVALFYKWYKTRNDKLKDGVDGSSNFKFKLKQKNQITKVESTISNDKVPLISGRSGANIIAIEKQTNVEIKFREKDELHQVCEITGQYENVMKAADLIKEELARSQSITDTVIIPTSAHKKICRQGAKVLRDICQRSFTQIHIDAGVQDKNSRRLMITGSTSNIQKAKKMIEEKVKQDFEEREMENKREPRYSPRSQAVSSSSEGQSKESASSISTTLTDSSPTPSIDMSNFTTNRTQSESEVYVSAVASPSRFWVQLFGPQINQLERLTEEMTEYYNKYENQEKHRIKEPYLGQIVAAMFPYDSKWYRAEIVGVLPNEYGAGQVILDLYYLDYGDSVYVNTNDVFEMRTDFLTLRYQAIECFLANVQPLYPSNNDWERNAINRFEELTHVAKWKKLTAKFVTTKERFKDGDSNKQESSPIPGIELYDIVDDHEVSIASTLILENFAIPSNHTESKAQASNYSDNVVWAGSSGNHSGSVAEKTMMFETGLQSNGNSPKEMNRNKSPTLSPSNKSKKKLSTKRSEQKEKSTKSDNMTDPSISIGNKSWAEIMEAESDDFP